MAMEGIWREPQVEQGRHNIILQNRCGNRLTALFHDGHVELEFLYKPNAFRRKDFPARNFSNRDVYTPLFGDAALPEMRAEFVEEFDYDPFHTRVVTEAPGGARNVISLLNIADENAFAIAAHCPLVLTFRPHADFVVEDGLLYEEFSDRGEGVVSFVAFDSFEENRYRVLEDGRHVLQLTGDDVALIGGEENLYQVRRALERLRWASREELLAHTERAIAPVLSRARLDVEDEELQRVLDLNRRIVYSGIDEGGACFGALNRIYHLIWVRDGSVTATQMARAGNPEILKMWTPFLLDNPSTFGNLDGRLCPEWLQMVGTRWTKREEDGLYHAVHCLFRLYQTTGDDWCLREETLRPLMDAVDWQVSTRWDEELEMFGSDTFGETTLAGSDYFGYDSVNGRMQDQRGGAGSGALRSYALRQNGHMYNVFRMMEILLAESPQMEDDSGTDFREWGDRMEGVLAETFTDPETGLYRSMYVLKTNGSYEWVDDDNPWGYTWVQTEGPFRADLNTALRSLRTVKQTWPEEHRYGYCPWNTLAEALAEHGLETDEFRAMFDDELRDALTETDKYPMLGALTEYSDRPEGWRALPFSAGGLLNAVGARILTGLPMGVAVRASDLVSSVTGYRFRTSLIDAISEGEGDVVQSARVNGRLLVDTLQIPEALLRAGPNRVEIVRGDYAGGPRLYGSDARLFSVEQGQDHRLYRMGSATRADLLFENLGDPAVLTVTDADGAELESPVEPVEGTDLHVVTVRALGEFTVRVSC
ncbi:MAG: hypothetical protein R6X33_04290 [Candidatus Brocadiia bacterium]